MSLLKIIRVFALIMSLFCVSATASANPGRFTLWLHGQHDLSDRYSLKSDLAIAGLQGRDIGPMTAEKSRTDPQHVLGNLQIANAVLP